MKRNFLLICILAMFLGMGSTQAQVKEKRSFLGFNIGLAMPGEDYGAYKLTSREDLVNGYVGSGPTFNVEGAGFFIPYLGLGGKLGIFANQLDAETLADDFFALYYGDAQPTYRAECDEGIAYTIYGMVGPYISLPLNRFSLDANFLVGYSRNSQPQRHIRAYNENGEQVSFQKYDKQTESALITDFGLGIRFFASEALAIKLGVDFLTTRPEYTNNIEDDFDISVEGDEERTTVTSTSDIRVTTFTLGLMFTL